MSNNHMDRIDSESSDEEEVYDQTMNNNDDKDGKSGIPDLPLPSYFEELTPAEIYDSFFSIKRMGFIANRIIRRLNETKHIVSSKILEKRKKLKAVQRKQFESLDPEGSEYLRVLLKSEINAVKTNQPESTLNMIPASTRARIAHLSEDSDCIALLNAIYTSDTNIRKLDYWKVLADRFVNHPSWLPRKVFNDERLHDVEPSMPCDEKFTPESLRSVFTRLRIEFTRTILRFHAAMKSTNTAREILETEFWDRYAKHDKAMYYIYRLCAEKNQETLMIDSVMAKAENDASDSLNSMKGMKRDRGDGSSMGVLDDFDHGMNMELMDGSDMNLRRLHHGHRDEFGLDDAGWKAVASKDRAVTNYYRRLSINNDIRFHIDMLSRENVGEAMKRNIKAKMNVLLMKKAEDRYDDL